MCESTGVLIIILILKILILLIIPLLIIFLQLRYRDKEKIIKILYLIEFVSLSLLIILKLFGNDCINNSNISDIKKISSINNSTIGEVVSTGSSDKILEPSAYMDSGGSKVLYYYNSNAYPISNYGIECNGTRYMKNYGLSIATLSTAVSTTLDKVVSVPELLTAAMDNQIFDCENGVNLDSLIQVINNKYSVIIKEISVNDIPSVINSDKLVIAKIEYNEYSNTNLTCDNGSIVIYGTDDGGNYKILNSNNKISSTNYICPEGTNGQYTIIKNESSKTYSLNEINSIGTKYYSIERSN